MTILDEVTCPVSLSGQENLMTVDITHQVDHLELHHTVDYICWTSCTKILISDRAMRQITYLN